MKQDKIWDYFQSHGEAASFKNNNSRLAYLAKLILPSDKRVLNIGVGNGFLEELLQSRGLDVFSLDPSEKAIVSLRNRLGMGESSAKTGYSQSIPFDDGTFDVVFMSEVIEHLDNEVLGKTLAEVSRVLAPSGLYIGTVPADENLKENEAVCPDCGKVFHRWGHVQSFTKHRLPDLFSRYFVDIKIARTYFGNPGTLNWKGKLSWLAKKALVSLGVNGAGESYYFVCHKK